MLTSCLNIPWLLMLPLPEPWLATARFKRFDLKEVVAKDSALYVYLPERVMSFAGQIEKTNKTPFGKGGLVAYHTDTD